MPNTYFQFKQFIVHQERCAMKVTTDSCLFGAWAAKEIADQLSKKSDTPSLLLDIGTGTGLLSLMIAQKNKVGIEAVEIDAESAAQASENIRNAPWHHLIEVIRQDIREHHPQKKYNFIISNPPFYEHELSSPFENRRRAHHSSELSLRELVHAVRTNLDSNGVFYLLLPVKRKTEVEDELQSSALFIQKICFVQQSSGHTAFRLLLSGGFTNVGEPEISEISIRDKDKKYTAEFITLLREYYLHL